MKGKLFESLSRQLMLLLLCHTTIRIDFSRAFFTPLLLSRTLLRASSFYFNNIISYSRRIEALFIV